MNKVICEKHGKQPETFVCQHIVKGLEENKSYGFFYASDPSSERPDAWCTSCNELIKKENGEWTEELMQLAKIKLICGICYDNAKKQNGL